MERNQPDRSCRKKIDMAFKIEKVRPLFTGVITTAQRYVGDITTEAGLLLANKREGTINIYQQVIAVGDMVHDVKEGDVVCINFKRYAKAKHTPGVIEDNIQSDNLSVMYEIPMININGHEYLYLQNNDLEYVVEKYSGVEAGGLFQ